jgi:hypothetical protein
MGLEGFMISSLLRSIVAALVMASVAGTAVASESDALELSSTIRERHLPHGTIVDPVFATPGSTEVDHYTRGGDSAIWTGHYLAAESYRFAVTRSPEALANVRAALKGIQGLVNVTGTGVLARVRLPVDWEDTVDNRAVITEEAGSGVYRATLKGTEYYWVGKTSRDQYVGVVFGLAVAYDLVDEAADPKVRPAIAKTVTRMLTFLLDNNWAVRMPDGSVSTVFTGRFDQQLMLLQVGKRVNPTAFGAKYDSYRKRYAALAGVPVAAEVRDVHSSYFKFNLDYAAFFTLIRLEAAGSARNFYLAAYRTLRDSTASHGNAHFDAIDRALRGADAARDARIPDLLDALLLRPRRDEWVDLTSRYAACGDNEACDPIPVVERVRTDFLWQRSPFQLSGGGDGRTESAGIDYILPYWMARYYGVALS